MFGLDSLHSNAPSAQWPPHCGGWYVTPPSPPHSTWGLSRMQAANHLSRFCGSGETRPTRRPYSVEPWRRAAWEIRRLGNRPSESPIVVSHYKPGWSGLFSAPCSVPGAVLDCLLALPGLVRLQGQAASCTLDACNAGIPISSAARPLEALVHMSPSFWMGSCCSCLMRVAAHTSPWVVYVVRGFGAWQCSVRAPDSPDLVPPPSIRPQRTIEPPKPRRPSRVRLW